MPKYLQAMLWAAFILIVAVVAKEQGADSSVTFGIIAGISGAALGIMNSGRARGCGSCS